MIGKQSSSVGIKKLNRALKSEGIPEDVIDTIKIERRKVKNCEYARRQRMTNEDLDNMEKKVTLNIAQRKIKFEKLNIEHKILDGILDLLRQYSFHIKTNWDLEKTEEDQNFMELITGFNLQVIQDVIFSSMAMSSAANIKTANGNMPGDVQTKHPKKKGGGFKGEDLERYLRKNLSQVIE